LARAKTNNLSKGVCAMLRSVWGVVWAAGLLFVAGCAGTVPTAAEGGGGEKPLIRLIANTWPASELNVNVAAILLRDQLGYPVEIIDLDEQAQWDALAAGDADASLEVWPSGHGERMAQYIDEQKVVETGGERQSGAG
jgi:glycine betaine/proline transport system substrate-binding protein